ncbi:3-hydroxyacyl-CoA dehydrogenase NAD-binding domain-containing protein [Flavihumibacter rivuli]|uniref:3-hydroxyacyl-CoA dehydrogenase NAD-binding domain-containing protein n=1 Tax=Flavihumibacter rivuli TaxID=2838156 RepID=UPI001BDF24AC|nr:3-hydroxyacyl-CoA dehydrogenase NAD-binding domain-containing protein [Flavihumibacter rivuli]ULQ56121.1 3-hydroxyacyl-CoA dehydrogenase NAD-binding domain-containing protein [Flavihumibacter rivuli]
MVKQICVCGAGTMGAGIAQAAAQHGFSVVLFDLNAAVIGKAEMAVQSNLDTLVTKEKISAEEKERILQRMLFTSSINDARADVIIEAIIEKLEAKQSLFSQLVAINDPGVIYATNTSSLPVTAIAATLPDPSRMVGMHFFNPATIMKLVEVVRTDASDPAVVQAIVDLAKAMGKTPVLCKDAPGFIVNRVARPYYIEALRLAEEGLDYATIDALMESCGFKMGPFRLMDLIGNDINYAVSCSVYDQLGSPERLKPSPIQEERVRSGNLGRKTGRGYYEY